MRAIQLEERALKEFAEHYNFVHGDEEWIEVSLENKLDSGGDHTSLSSSSTTSSSRDRASKR